MRRLFAVLALASFLPACSQVCCTTQRVSTTAQHAYYSVGRATRQAPECGPLRVTDPVYDAGWCGAGGPKPITTGAFDRPGA